MGTGSVPINYLEEILLLNILNNAEISVIKIVSLEVKVQDLALTQGNNGFEAKFS